MEAEKAASKRSVELAARLQEARARVLTDDGNGGGGSGGSGGVLSENGISSQLAEIRKLGLELQVKRKGFFFVGFFCCHLGGEGVFFSPFPNVFFRFLFP